MTTKWREKLGLTKVQGQIDSNDGTHFTPNHSPYWVFVGLFFVCYLLSIFWDAGEDTPLSILENNLPETIVNQNPSNSNVLYERLVNKLNYVSDFGQMTQLEDFLVMQPDILDSIPSSVPLFRESFVLSSPYGERHHPIHHVSKKHFGVDLAANLGTPIYSTAAGIVTHIGDDPKGHGIYVTISHAHGFSTLYGHMDTVAVTLGEQIPPHEYIGTVGRTGLTTGPHLHYETIKNGKRVDPVPSFSLKYWVYLHLTQKN